MDRSVVAAVECDEIVAQIVVVVELEAQAELGYACQVDERDGGAIQRRPIPA